MQTKKPKLNERPPTLEEMRTRLNLDSYVPYEEDPNAAYNDNIKNQEENKARKLELMNGHGNLLKGIYNNTSTSNYQETYKYIYIF